MNQNGQKYQFESDNSKWKYHREIYLNEKLNFVESLAATNPWLLRFSSTAVL